MQLHEDSSVARRPLKHELSARTHADHGAHVAAIHGIARSSQWDDVVREHLARQPHCICCSTRRGRTDARPTGRVQVHHIFPFHYCIALGRPDLELDVRNLITLYGSRGDNVRGQNHHLWVGHLDDFQASNLSVVRDARTTFHGMLARDFKTDSRWLRRERRKLMALDLMNEEDKEMLLRLMNRRMPR